MYNTLLFDFDGTLAPSLQLWVEAYQYAALTMGGLELTEETVLEKCFFRSFLDVAADLGLSPGSDFAQQMDVGLERGFTSERLLLFPKVLELLESCKEAGLALGIVTTCSRLRVTAALARLGIADYFDTVVSHNDVENYKPHPEPVELALTRLQKLPGKTLFVGDYITDVQAGRAAGTYTALFLPEEHTRFYSFGTLRAAAPDFIFSHYSELIEHLQQTVFKTIPL
ncbi:MAG: HAD family hydrolase [Chloroflexota bacterium]